MDVAVAPFDLCCTGFECIAGCFSELCHGLAKWAFLLTVAELANLCRCDLVKALQKNY